jgi:sugar lactone lactonase YvrE
VTGGVGAINVFSAPITSSSTVSFSIINGFTDTRGLTFDSSGNLWINAINGANPIIAKYTPPFSSGSTPSLSFVSSGNIHGIAFDTAGNLYATGTSGVDVYAPPFSAATTKSFTMAASGPNYLKFDRSGNLYVTDSLGHLLVFTPPFSGSSVPAVTVPLPGSPGLPGVAIGP